MNYRTVPVAYCAAGVERYIEEGIRPGSFLYAVFCYDLAEMTKLADTENYAHLSEWVAWVKTQAPEGCWGSESHVSAWIRAGGRRGLWLSMDERR